MYLNLEYEKVYVDAINDYHAAVVRDIMIRHEILAMWNKFASPIKVIIGNKLAIGPSTAGTYINWKDGTFKDGGYMPYCVDPELKKLYGRLAQCKKVENRLYSRDGATLYKEVMQKQKRVKELTEKIRSALGETIGNKEIERVISNIPHMKYFLKFNGTKFCSDWLSLAEYVKNNSNYNVYMNSQEYSLVHQRGIVDDILISLIEAKYPKGVGLESYFKNYVKTTYSGGSYYGTMKNGKPHGIGSFDKGFKYSGQWCNGLWNGVGVLESDGEIYIGYFTDHLKTGYGVKLYSTCDTYEGFFKNNDRHGKGTMYFANGTVQEGYWVQDRYIGKNPPVYQR